MGEVASVLHALSCRDCARYVCSDASIRSQCCDEDDLCNCDVETHQTEVIEAGEETEECHTLCCNCLFKHNK